MRHSRVLLIAPYYPGSVFSETYLDAGLGYVSEMLNAAGIVNHVLDMRLHPGTDELLSTAREFDPDLIGITMRSLYFRKHYALVAEIKRAFPEAHVVAGGPHISSFRERALAACPELDYGIVLEGEGSIVELCQDELPLEEIRGLIYRKACGEIVYRGDRPFCQDLDSVPFPTYSQFELDRYRGPVPIVSSRGCPYQCVYCPVKVTIGRLYRSRNPVLVADEVEWWYRAGRRDFDFTDDNFTLIPERAYEFCEEIARRNLKGLQLSCGNGIRADRVDRRLLSKMKEVGFYQLSFGVEAGNNRILGNIKKGERLEEIEQAIGWACELGFEVKLTFIIGSPGETWEDFKDSIRLALKYPVWKFNFFNLIPFPHTELHDWITANDYWLVDPEEHLNEVEHWTSRPAFWTPEMSAEQRVQAFELAHGLMTKCWQASERRSRRRLLRGKLETRGIPPAAAGLLAAIRVNDLIPLIDERQPWLGRALRRLASRIMKAS